jgi:hypothetical protein
MLHHHVQNEWMLLIGRLAAEPQQPLESQGAWDTLNILKKHLFF